MAAHYGMLALQLLRMQRMQAGMLSNRHATGIPQPPILPPCSPTTQLQLFNAPYLLTEEAWCYAEGLSDPACSPSLRQLSVWAARYRCYVAATLLEATPEGHFYNALVLAAPDGSFVRRQQSSGGAGGHDGVGRRSKTPGSSGAQASSGSSGGSSGGSVALVRKHRASSLEGFVFRSGGAPSRGGEPAAHVLELEAAPLLRKRGLGGGGGGGGGDAHQSGMSSGGRLAPRLRVGVAICYENMCWPPMQAILVGRGAAMPGLVGGRASVLAWRAVPPPWLASQRQRLHSFPMLATFFPLYSSRGASLVSRSLAYKGSTAVSSCLLFSRCLAGGAPARAAGPAGLPVLCHGPPPRPPHLRLARASCRAFFCKRGGRGPPARSQASVACGGLPPHRWVGAWGNS